VKLCLIADARSPIAQNWINFFCANGHEVHVLSSYPCEPDVLPRASLHVLPVAFSALSEATKGKQSDGSATAKPASALLRRSREHLTAIAAHVRYWLGPFDVYRRVKQVRQMIVALNPDLVHAMRIPFEGLLAAEALRHVPVPLMISVWGNDFTFHAKGSPLMRHLTRRAMERTDALHPDCYRDARLGAEWGLAAGKPVVVLPGSGGVQRNIFYPGRVDESFLQKWNLALPGPVVFYPRRFRPGSVRTDTFFQAVSSVLSQRPDVTCLCIGMAGHPVAEQWKRTLANPDAVRLLPTVPREEMAHFFRLADVTVSPSQHDGTPNTLLEGIACGAFPVAGDIESVREWITDGENGLLCDPTSSSALATAIHRALVDSELRRHAFSCNQALVNERAEYQTVMAKAEAFYAQVIAHGSYTLTTHLN